MLGSPRGIVWVPTQKTFYFSAGVTQVFSTLEDGTPSTPINITFLPTTDVSQIIYTEALGHLPKLSKAQAESLLVATEHNGDCIGHIQVVRLSDGVVTRVLATVGQQVERGQRLAEFEPQT